MMLINYNGAKVEAVKGYDLSCQIAKDIDRVSKQGYKTAKLADVDWNLALDNNYGDMKRFKNNTTSPLHYVYAKKYELETLDSFIDDNKYYLADSWKASRTLDAVPVHTKEDDRKLKAIKRAYNNVLNTAIETGSKYSAAMYKANKHLVHVLGRILGYDGDFYAPVVGNITDYDVTINKLRDAGSKTTKNQAKRLSNLMETSVNNINRGVKTPAYIKNRINGYYVINNGHARMISGLDAIREAQRVVKKIEARWPKSEATA